MTDLPEVRLRPLTPADVPALEAASGPEADPFNWAGHTDPGALAATIAARQILSDPAGGGRYRCRERGRATRIGEGRLHPRGGHASGAVARWGLA